ncbi:chloride channel protein, partial [mine drainage metagenome]
MNSSASPHEVRDTLRDFTADRRMLMLCAMALVTGTFGAIAAWALVKLIALFTNFAYFQVISTTTT